MRAPLQGVAPEEARRCTSGPRGRSASRRGRARSSCGTPTTTTSIRTGASAWVSSASCGSSCDLTTTAHRTRSTRSHWTHAVRTRPTRKRLHDGSDSGGTSSARTHRTVPGRLFEGLAKLERIPSRRSLPPAMTATRCTRVVAPLRRRFSEHRAMPTARSAERPTIGRRGAQSAFPCTARCPLGAETRRGHETSSARGDSLRRETHSL